VGGVACAVVRLLAITAADSGRNHYSFIPVRRASTPLLTGAVLVVAGDAAAAGLVMEETCREGGANCFQLAVGGNCGPPKPRPTAEKSALGSGGALSRKRPDSMAARSGQARPAAHPRCTRCSGRCNRRTCCSPRGCEWGMKTQLGVRKGMQVW